MSALPSHRFGRASTARISAAVKAFGNVSQRTLKKKWAQAVVSLVASLRPELASATRELFDLENKTQKVCVRTGSNESECVFNPLGGLSIGELSVVYEALLALADSGKRKGQGQFFTPDDVAGFMALQAKQFPKGDWIDPCCGVGNLAWHLASVQEDPNRFVRESLHLCDIDKLALKTAAVLLVVSFAKGPNYESALESLWSRSYRRSFIATPALRVAQYAILNPPYAPAGKRRGFATSDIRDTYAYFFERVLKTVDGFVIVTPSSFLGNRKFSSLRTLLRGRKGGKVFVFDNVPDTLFRGFKYGSTNTSTTNFVRSAITVSDPRDQFWQVTPILRWASSSRDRMFEEANKYLGSLRIGPVGVWLRLYPNDEPLLDALESTGVKLADLVSDEPADEGLQLEVATTPRYYVSATRRKLDRSSKIRLNFPDEESLRRAYLILNSSLPYWWWRVMDGGVTLKKGTLLSLPIPMFDLEGSDPLVESLARSENCNLQIKLNAGRNNENVRHQAALVRQLNAFVLGEGIEQGLVDPNVINFDACYDSDMFSEHSVGVSTPSDCDGH